MKRLLPSSPVVFLALALGLASSVPAQNPPPPPPGGGPDFNGQPPPFDPNFQPPGGRRGGGPGGFGGPGGEQVKLVKQFDKDDNKRLDTIERAAAREFLAKEKAAGRGGRRGGGPGGGGGNQTPVAPGLKISPSEVKSFSNAPLYDPLTVRTLFLDFENADWEKEMADFYHTDVEVPATLLVDGKTYKDVGVHFRGASSFFTVGEGRKRSLNLSLDFANDEQRLLGYRGLSLLNSHGDPTYLRSVLYYQIAREYIPAPKANFVRVVINGENWGVYVNAQQFNKDLVKDFFATTAGARWKVPGSPNARGGLAYLGENVADYKRSYEIKSKDDPKSWADFIKLCRVLNQTPADKLEEALAPILDIDGALKFLALENVLINNDGYWVRTSDYSIYQDEKGRFHLLPHDANETFSTPGGPGGRGGGRGGPGGGGGGGGGRVELDPLSGANDAGKPLLNKLLAVPALKTRYLGFVRTITEQWLDWNKVGPLAKKYQSLIAADVKADTRKLGTYEAFTSGLGDDEAGAPAAGGPPRGFSLKNFVEQRRAYLLKQTETKKEAGL